MSRKRAAPPPPAPMAPMFGVEIEIFVRLKPSVEKMIRRKQINREQLPPYLQDWRDDLSNDSTDIALTIAQRTRVGTCIKALISQELGTDDLGWRCELDGSLRQGELTAPPDPRKWWGIEVISPPFSVNRHFQQEIEQVFEAIGQYFDFWTTEHTSCHVHVSPGPTKGSKYTPAEYANVAKGAYFWENALLDLLPVDRKSCQYALPNYQLYATAEYSRVAYDGWEPVFKKIDATAKKGLRAFVEKMMGTEVDPQGTRYASHNFEPLDCEVLGTIEFRRQAGVASAETAIYRALLAVTLHISARTYDFKKAQSRKSHPSSDELIAELARCETLLPKTCVTRKGFVKWLKECQKDYRGGKRFTEKETNDREAKLRPPSIRNIEPATTGQSSASARTAQSTATTSSGRANTNTLEVRSTRPVPGNISYSWSPSNVQYSSVPRTSAPSSNSTSSQRVVAEQPRYTAADASYSSVPMAHTLATEALRASRSDRHGRRR